MIETTKLDIAISDWMTLIFIQGHSCVKMKKNFGVHFLANLSIDLDEIQYVTTTCSFLEENPFFFLFFFLFFFVQKYYSRERTLLA